GVAGVTGIDHAMRGMSTVRAVHFNLRHIVSRLREATTSWGSGSKYSTLAKGLQVVHTRSTRENQRAISYGMKF
ncbi:MAG: hypothetical protein KDE24_02965, partial [Caldilinea sp.]|nr:hypothetical protein [Caldilinea sp.]